MNLGTEFSQPREQWPQPASRIKNIIDGQLEICKPSPEIEALAQNYAALIIQSRQKDNTDNYQPEYREVNIDSLEMTKPRSVACEHVALEAIKTLGLDQYLNVKRWIDIILFQMMTVGQQPWTSTQNG